MVILGIHRIVFYDPKLHVVFDFILQDFAGQQFPNCQKYSRKLGVNVPVSYSAGKYLWVPSCTIDEVLLLHSVVLPKMVVRSVHKERK